MHKKTRPLHMLQETQYRWKDTCWLKVNEYKKTFHLKKGNLKIWVAIVISDKNKLQNKVIIRDKEEPSNLTSEYLPEETQNTNLKRHMHPYVHCSIIYNSQDTEATQVSISRWMDKEVVQIDKGIWLSH